MTADRVRAFLDDLRLGDPTRHELVEAVRALALGLAPAMGEQMKYGGILFGADEPFCGVFAYRDHVSVEFGEGSSLADPCGVLEGKGKHRRHIKLTALADIDGKQVRAYLEQARDAAR